MLKAVLVTSRLHFVPDNYNGFLQKLSSSPHIAGLIVLDNLESQYLLKAVGLGVAGARRIGSSLAKNYFSSLLSPNSSFWREQGKKVWRFSTINDDGIVDLIQQEGVDLLVNARTRFIYRKPVLTAPRLGCINIHHGLLPEQRGTMCDLWALSRGEVAGFSVHVMNEKIDDGGIIGTYPVGKAKNYYQYLQKSADLEAQAIEDVLQKTSDLGELPATTANLRTNSAPHFRNPTLGQLRKMQMGGMKL